MGVTHVALEVIENIIRDEHRLHDQRDAEDASQGRRVAYNRPGESITRWVAPNNQELLAHRRTP